MDGHDDEMSQLPRTDCPVCQRDTAILPTGLLYRHDPSGGRTPDLRSCPGSLKAVAPPYSALVLFVDPYAHIEPPDVHGAQEGLF
jgi:hypothetical protein